MGDDTIDGLVEAGMHEVPGFSLVQKVWSVVRPPNAAERFEKAKQEYDSDLAVRQVEAIWALQNDLRAHRLELDDLAPLRALAISEKVAANASEATGEPKVEAVLNAGARQFDPRMGPQETRRYWLDRVVLLADLEVRVLMLAKERGPLFFFSHPGLLYWGDPPARADLPAVDCVAMGSVLLDLQQAHELVTNAQAVAEIDNYSTRGSVLTARGEELVRFIQPIVSEESG